MSRAVGCDATVSVNNSSNQNGLIAAATMPHTTTYTANNPSSTSNFVIAGTESWLATLGGIFSDSVSATCIRNVVPQALGFAADTRAHARPCRSFLATCGIAATDRLQTPKRAT